MPNEIFHTSVSAPVENLAFEQLLTKSLSYLDPSAEALLRKAFIFASRMHQNQKRKSGEPFILHPIAVAEILTEFKLDKTSLASAILHDTVEDTEASIELIQQEFGEQVAMIVDGLTKLGRMSFHSKQENMAENFRKMFLAMAKDIRVVLVKLADRTHNMRTIKGMPPERQLAICQETIDIYAPLAGRLGIHKLKAELEDLSLKELNPEIYTSLVEKIHQKKSEREKIIHSAQDFIIHNLKKQGINAEVQGRAKHFYSIYNKMYLRKKEFTDIYDLFALRVIVKDIPACYEVLGFVHSLFKPVPGRFKDYIAMPKANLYQSLHTTVIAGQGELLEIQIRTNSMHIIAEHGIAAHWLYKESIKNVFSSETERTTLPKPHQGELQVTQKFQWFQEMVQNQSKISDPNEFLENLKIDLFDDVIYVLSPKGDIYELQRGASSLDFAFAIHSELGLHTLGAKVNGRIVPLKKEIKTGDVVEIMTSPSVRARNDWLNITQTSKAKSKIRNYLRSLTKEETPIEEVILEEETKKSLLPPKILPTGKAIPTRTTADILVQGLNHVLIRFAKCCQPLHGEPIVGYISQGTGVIIHGQFCPLGPKGDRAIACSWPSAESTFFNVYLKVTVYDHPGILADMTKTISHMKINIVRAEVQTDSGGLATILACLAVKSSHQFIEVQHKLENMEGVVEVKRIGKIE